MADDSAGVAGGFAEAGGDEQAASGDGGKGAGVEEIRWRNVDQADCGGATKLLPFVHVFDADCSTQLPPQREIVDYIGVNDDGPASICNRLKLPDELGFGQSLSFTGRVKRDVLE